MKWFTLSKPEPDPRPARVVLAEAMRQLASGTITNFQFENRFGEGPEDKTAREIDCFTWLYYDDFTEHRLRGKWRLTREDRQAFARCVLFLRSDLEYSHESPVRIPIATTLFTVFWRSIMTLTSPWKNWKNIRSSISQTKQAANEGYWPFANREDYNESLKNPIYLAGTPR